MMLSMPSTYYTTLDSTSKKVIHRLNLYKGEWVLLIGREYDVINAQWAGYIPVRNIQVNHHKKYLS